MAFTYSPWHQNFTTHKKGFIMKETKIISLIIFTILFFLITRINANSIKNGDFTDDINFWDSWGAQYSDGRLLIKNNDHKWSGANQYIYIPENTVYIEVSGKAKTENVIRGEMTLETAQLTIEYFDKAGKHLDPYPDKTISLSGSNDWKRYYKQYGIPEGVDKVNLIMALGNAKGTVWFDDISLIFMDKDKNHLKAKVKERPTDYGRWYPLNPKIETTGSHYVNWSSLLDAPAGKHGFLTTKNDKFIFEDGTPAKFFGSVLIAHDAFKSKEKVDSLVARLSKMGSNMLRLHLLDAEWAEPNIFGNKENTLEIDEDVVKKMDYLVYKCKEAGIYIFFDMLSARQFYEKDGVMQAPKELGGKQVGFFSRQLIELQKTFITQIMNHENVYTKIKYKDEPAIALSEFINETTIYTQFGENHIVGQYKEELDNLWKEAGNSGKRPIFTLNYDNDYGILENTVRESNTEDGIKFYKSLEDKYYWEMNNHIKSIGSKTLFAGSNMPEPILAMTESYSHLDFCANDAYWDHPQTWLLDKPWKDRFNAIIDNNSQLDCEYSNTIQKLSYFNVHNKPFVAWGDQTYPNEYQMEGNVLLTAYGSLQGWDGIIHHRFSFAIPGTEALDHFDFFKQPEDIALWTVLAPAYLKGYIKEAPGEIIEKVSNEQLFESGSYSYFLEQNYQLPLITKVSKKFVDVKNEEDSFDPNYNDYFNKENGEIISETNELIYNYKKGTLKINAPKVQGQIGNNRDNPISLPLFKANISNPYSAIFAIAADDKPLINSNHFYLVAVTSSKMHNQAYNADHTKLNNKGELPVLCQYLDGIINFNTTKKVTMNPLTISGEKLTKLSAMKSKLKNSFDLSNIKTFVYEVSIR